MNSRLAVHATVLLLPLLVGAAVPRLASATPRYSARYGQDCSLCHVNPTGGGQREMYASRFIVPEELAARAWSAAESEAVSPELAPSVLFGLDLRTLMYQQEGGAGSTFSMQGDIYLSAGLGEGFLAYVEQGQSGSGEIFGAARGLPLDGYLKAGRFVPDHGWRFADHQLFTRRYLGSDDGTDSPTVFYGSGVEGGVSPGRISLTASVLGETESHGDAYAAKIFLHQPLGPVNAGIGGSVLRRNDRTEDRRAAAALWYLSWGPVTWVGEYDETRRDDRLGNLAANEVTVTVSRGVDLRGTYSFQDPDRAEQNGLRQRYGAGVAWMPRPFFDVLVMANHWRVDPGELVTDESRHEAELVIHFFY